MGPTLTHHRAAKRVRASRDFLDDAALARPGDRVCIIAELAQHGVGVLALIGGRAQLVGLPVAAYVDWLADHLLGAELWVADRLGDPEMLNLRIGKGLVDRIDRPARPANFIEPLAPIRVWVLPNDLGEMRIECRPVSGARDPGLPTPAIPHLLSPRH